VGVDHGGFDVFVAEQFLDGADVAAALQEVGGEGMTESVRGDGFVNFCELGGAANCFLQDAWVYMVAHGLFGAGVSGKRDSGEEVLPHFFF